MLHNLSNHFQSQSCLPIIDLTERNLDLTERKLEVLWNSEKKVLQIKIVQKIIPSNKTWNLELC